MPRQKKDGRSSRSQRSDILGEKMSSTHVYTPNFTRPGWVSKCMKTTQWFPERNLHRRQSCNLWRPVNARQEIPETDEEHLEGCSCAQTLRSLGSKGEDKSTRWFAQDFSKLWDSYASITCFSICLHMFLYGSCSKKSEQACYYCLFLLIILYIYICSLIFLYFLICSCEFLVHGFPFCKELVLLGFGKGPLLGLRFWDRLTLLRWTMSIVRHHTTM